ncbi:MAG: radical SAM protein [Thermodesulfobacteriota bacterium]
MSAGVLAFHLNRLRYLWKGRRALPRYLRTYCRYRFRPDLITLRSLSILLGYACSCRCAFCSVEQLKGTSSAALGVEEITDLVDQGLALGVVNVTLSGGEPLLYMDKLAPVIRHVRSRGALATVATTGLGLAEHLPELAAAGLRNVFISLGGIGQVHDASRHVDGLFEQAMAGLRQARAMGLFVGVRGIATEENIADGSLERLITYLGEQDLLLTCTPIYSGRVETEEGRVRVLSPQGQARLREMQARYPNFMLDVYANLNYPACPAMHEWITILSDGEAVPCAGIMVSVGNVREHSLRDLLAKARSIPDFGSVTPLCKSGEDEAFCRRWIEPIHDSALPVRVEDHPYGRTLGRK